MHRAHPPHIAVANEMVSVTSNLNVDCRESLAADEVVRGGFWRTLLLPGLPSQPDEQGRQVLLHFDLLTEILHCDLKTTNPKCKRT